MNIHIPNSAFLGNIDRFLKGFDPKKPEILKVSANSKWISIHPMGLSMIAALGIKTPKSDIECEEITARSKHYLERMGLFKFLKTDHKRTITEHEPAGRFVPLSQIKTSDELSTFLQEITPLLHLNKKHSETIRHIMSELIRNVIEHSLSEHGAIVCAQFYEKSNRISIGIADTGVGIWHSINQSHSPPNDLEAIRLALTPGITGATRKEGGTEQNAGAGLFINKSIATVNRDFFVIYSGNAMYKLLKRNPKKRISLHADPFDDNHSKRDDLPNWQGTAVGIDISLDTTQELTFLLDLINETYKSAIKERKKARYRKPLFIP